VTVLKLWERKVSIVTGYRLDDLVFDYLQEHVFLSSSKCPNWLWGPPSLLFNGCEAFFPHGNWWKCEVDHSLPSSAEVRNEWSYTSTPPIFLHIERDEFTCTCVVNVKYCSSIGVVG
jgi:hypothetical protein